MNKPRFKRYLLWLMIAALTVCYFCVFFAQGFWHNHVFLYKTGDGIFKSVTGCMLEIQKTDTQTDIVFTFNGLSKQYQVIHTGQPLQILENKEIIYTGAAIFDGDRYYLEDENGELILNESHIGSENAFPSRTELLNWALLEKPAMHGHILSLILLVIAAIGLSLTFLKRFRNSRITKRLRILLLLLIAVFAIRGLILP